MGANIQGAIDYLRNNPRAKVSAVARQFEVTRSLLRSRLNGHASGKGKIAANKRLSETEEKALCAYIDRLDRISLAVRPEFVTDAANRIIKERASSLASPRDIQPVGGHWTTRFMQRHGYDLRKQQALNADRQAAEDVNRVAEFYEKLFTIISEYGILPSNIWNMDETGFRIGIGKNQMIVTKRKRAHYFGIPENRESATAIEAISAAGNYIPGYLILSGQLHMSQWYAVNELDPQMAIHPTPTGYSNDEVSLDWLKHFEQHTYGLSQGAWRLLLLDGHGSHHTRDFIQYCDDHKIIPFGLPPNLTHLIQPLDVVVFQPLKHYHTKALDLLVRDGICNIGKIEFLGLIEGVRQQAFKQSTILSAFKKTGIEPFNPNIVLNILKERVTKTPTPEPIDLVSLPPQGTPTTLRYVYRVAGEVSKKVEEDTSIDPELRAQIKHLANGAVLHATQLVQTRRDLGRTLMAERVRKQRRSLKNTPLQSGSRLTVEQARQMVIRKEEDAVAKALKVVEAAEQRARNHAKRTFGEAAKQARKWRIDGKLSPAEVIELLLSQRLLKRELRRF